MATDRTVPELDESGDEPVRGLAAVGLSAVEERVFRALLGAPGTTASQLAESVNLSPARLRRALSVLEQAGLVSRTPDRVTRFLPAAPDVGLEALVLAKSAELGQVRTLARHLMDDYRLGHREGPAELFEIITGSQAVLHRFDQLQRSATSEIQALDTPPYAGPQGPRTNDVEFDVLERGVECKAIYDRAALERSPRAVEAIMRYVEAGEQARVTTRLPLKLATFDRKVAFVPHTIDQRDVAGAIVVHRCSLLDLLLYVFDGLWESATPLVTGGMAASGEPDADLPTPDEQRLLALLASGLTDEAMSHHLGWSYRTTRRRVAGLLQRLGVDTRFQAGLAAARRGWL